MNFYNNKIFVRGLLLKCPMRLPLENCPLSEYRILPLKTRMELVNKMSEEDITEITDYHKQCLAKRQQEKECF